MKKYFVFLLLVLSYGVFSQTPPEVLIQDFLQQKNKRSHFSKEDLNDWFVESRANSKATGIENYYIKQRFSGVEIEGTTTNFLIKGNKVLEAEVRFQPQLQQRIKSVAAKIQLLQSVAIAFRTLGIKEVDYPFIEKKANRFTLKQSKGDSNPINGKAVYKVLPDGSIRLTWNLTFYSPDYKHLWNVYVDAENGQILEKKDWTHQCHFETCFSSTTKKIDFSTKLFSKSNYFQSPESASYRVVPYFVESPNHGARELITSPEKLTASPYGWHDTDGISGAEHTITRGNNVWAKEDRDGNNEGGISPDGGSALLFDFAYSGTTTSPASYTSAATTNLFYMSNIMHDVFYQYGFDEFNGNFQLNNYNKGGVQDDFLQADSQDASDVNNANFATPPDGFSPRMQLFLWNIPPQPMLITVNSPFALSGMYAADDNNFTNGHVALPMSPSGITADLVLFNDGVPDVSDACSSAVNASSLNGKIVLIRRGSCTFTDKVIAAQNAGALAVIVVNNTTGKIIMAGDNVGITIPAISVSQEIGENLIAALQNGVVNVTLANQPTDFINSDSDFDNGVIAHEYGHGISTRLTGGAGNSNCLESSEQMGEGWSDFFALMLQMKQGDSGTSKRGIATFLNNEATDGNGIRLYPYSTDMSINPLTFGRTNGMTFQENGETKVNKHAVGTVWASVLWDLAWAYVEKYGFNSDVYNGDGGNNKALQLIIDALKLQPCNPSFIEGRNAILLADKQTTGGENFCLIWEVFARRGLGINASSGTNEGVAGINDQVEDFTVPLPDSNCDIFQASNEVLVFPNPVSDFIKIRMFNYQGPLTVSIFDVNGRMINRVSEAQFNFEKTIDMTSLQSGIYFLRIEGNGFKQNRKLIVN